MRMYAVGACVEATKCDIGCSVDVKNCGVEVKKRDVFLLLMLLFRLCQHLLDNFKAKEHGCWWSLPRERRDIFLSSVSNTGTMSRSFRTRLSLEGLSSREILTSPSSNATSNWS